MNEIVCIRESVYRGALTRGNTYRVIAEKPEEGKVRVEADNRRMRWFPDYCFAPAGTAVPTLSRFTVDGKIENATDDIIEVTVELSDGQRRWCWFGTPKALIRCGELIDGTNIRFHFGLQHFIVATSISLDLIEKMLWYIDGQGDLLDCTRPLEEKQP